MSERLASIEDDLLRLDAHRALALVGDAEGVRKLRRALRRLRAWLRLGGHRRLGRELRRVSRELGPLRDFEVLGGVLNEHTRRAARPLALQRAVSALRSGRWRRAREALATVPPPTRRDGLARLKQLERRLGKFKLEHDSTSLHALRKLVRRVRLTRQWLGRTTSDLDATQKLLGVCCDLLLLERFADTHRTREP